MARVAVVSGYKAYELGIFKQSHPAVKYIKQALLKQLTALVEEGLEWVIISGQPGVELWAAEVVFELQQFITELKLSVLTPFLNQEDKWSESNKEWYESVVVQADYVDSISKKSYEKPWQLKLANQFFIQKSDVLVMLYDDEKEGSPRFLLDAAKERKLKDSYDIRLISFYDLQLMIEEEQFNREDF